MSCSINADNGVISGITGIRTTADNTGNLALQTNGNTVLTLNTSNAAVFAGSVTANSVVSTSTINVPNTFGFKNRIINGGMTIDQRNAGAAVTPTDGQYTLDRWAAFMNPASKYTIQQNAGSVTPPTGFNNYLGLTSSSAYSLSATDYFGINQYIEGLNFADLGWGTANAKTITISFWVRSSLTGTFGGSLRNSASNRSYPFSYTINSANTWEYETITIAGDTTGTWLTTNGKGVGVNFSVGTGSTYSGTAGSWSANNYLSATGATSVVGTNGATFYITGVQLEAGSQATSFDFRDYGRELQMCQRYYEIIRTTLYSVYGMWAANAYFVTPQFKFSVTKRATPTVPSVSTTGNALWCIPGLTTVSAATSTTFDASSVTTDGCSFTQNRVSGGITPTSGNVYLLEGAVNFIAYSEL